MGRFIVRRLIQTIPLVIGITILTFALANLVPGSPVSNLELDPGTSPEDIARIRSNLGLDEPIHVRYFVWMSNLVQGDFGLSLQSHRPVATIIMERLPNTLLLTASALALSLLFSIPVGVYAALKRNSWFDQAATLGAVGGVAVPNFWLGLMMILLFSVMFREWGLPALPSGGTHTVGTDPDIIDRLRHLIMPAIVLAFAQTAAWTRYIRSQMIEILRQDYMRSAQAKGLKDYIVTFRHGLRNALLPLVTLLALDIPQLFSGAVITEVIFSWNGIGRLIVDSTFQRDYTVIMGTVVIVSFLTIFANLIADVMYAVLDPRIRYD
ncbi:MAG: ABC transporter permease [Thermomicrobiaceae bacterium]